MRSKEGLDFSISCSWEFIESKMGYSDHRQELIPRSKVCRMWLLIIKLLLSLLPSFLLF